MAGERFPPLDAARMNAPVLNAPILARGPSLSTQAHRHLKMLFMLGEMEPGRRLAYREMADRLGISVTPAREALFKLVAEKIIGLGPSGVIVVPELSAAACRELWSIRILLEGHCAEVAAQHATPALIKQMARSHELMVRAKQMRHARDGMRHNLDFHFALYREARLPILQALIEDVWARSAAYVRHFHAHHVERRTDSATMGPHVHATILAALRAGDAAKVRTGLERDLLEVRDGILNLLEDSAGAAWPVRAKRRPADNPIKQRRAAR